MKDVGSETAAERVHGEQILICHNTEQTRALAARVARQLPKGAVLALVGELGAGKTCFVQGLADALGVLDPKQVLSPTYALVHEYPCRDLLLVHMDLYRLDSVESFEDLGLQEYFYRKDAVVAVEWADKLPELMPKEALWCKISWRGEGRVLCLRGLDSLDTDR